LQFKKRHSIQKFDYLKEYLKGEARLFVENLELTDANYQIAIDQLKATYGKEEVLINDHFDKLDALQPLRDGKDVAALRNLQLTIQSHICALETLWKPKSSYGSLLGTKLIKLVPYKLQQKWAEVATNDSTDIDKILKFIMEQTEAAERLNTLKSGEKSKSRNQSNSQPPKEFSHPAYSISISNRSQISSDFYKTYANNTYLTFNKIGVNEMTIMQDIRFDKYNFQFKGFTYLYESDSEIEEDEANFSALDEEWVEDNEEEDDRTQEKTIPDLADHALVLVFRPYQG
jgi:hypothetical protein